MFKKSKLSASLVLAFGSAVLVSAPALAQETQRVEITGSSIKRIDAETALPPLLFADAQTEVRVSAGAVRSDVTVNFRILRAGVSTFQFEVPAGAQVLAVDGQGIKEWKPLGEKEIGRAHV